MADFFIKRPILSICLSIIIVLLGTFSILRLPISEYPDIIPPSIQVTADLSRSGLRDGGQIHCIPH